MVSKFTFLTFCLSLLSTFVQGQTLTAFTGARLIDGTGAPAVENSVLLVRDGRIVDAGAMDSVAIPGEAERINLAGKTVIPGLINAHGHAAGGDTEATLLKYARYGVTTVVSLGGENASHVALRDAQDPAAPNGARFLLAGPVQEHQSVEAAIRGIAAVKALGADWVKARVQTGSMPGAAYTALIAEAHRQELKVAAHMYSLADTRGLVGGGVDVLAHSVRDAPVDGELLAMMQRNDTCLVPTLAREVSTFIYETTPAFFSDPFFTRYADMDVVTDLNDPAAQRRMAANAQRGKNDLAMAQRNLKTIADAGIRVAMGTDSGSPARFAGYFEHLELELMAQAGLTPMQVLVAATGAAADCMDLEDVGTLEPGKWADFLVLGANPLEDVRNSKSLEAVWMAGRRISL